MFKELSTSQELDLDRKKVLAAFSTLPKNGFSIRRDAQSIASHLGLDESIVVEILCNFKAEIYPDVETFLTELKRNNSLPVIWTQGEVGEEDLNRYSDDLPISDIPFQIAKIKKSGLGERLENSEFDYGGRGLKMVYGGPNKTSYEFLAKLFTQQAIGLFSGGVVFVDDQLKNLINLQNWFSNNPNELNTKPQLFLIQRDTDDSGSVFSDDINRINTLSEIKNIVPSSLFFLDLDRTLIDTNKLKDSWYQNLSKAVGNQQKNV